MVKGPPRVTPTSAAPPRRIARSHSNRCVVSDAGQGDGLRARLLRVKTGDKLSINEKRALEFQLTNTPRWPDGEPD